MRLAGVVLAAAAANCDCAVHLAAERADDLALRARHVEAQADCAENVVRAAATQGVGRLVFLSSVAVYGLNRPLAPESAALRPYNDYARGKQQAESAFLRWAASGPDSRSLLILRSAAVFGEGSQGNVHRLIQQIRRGRFRMVGHGGNRKSIAYVGNLVDFIARRLGVAPGIEILNYADKPDWSTRELVERIRALLPGVPPSSLTVPYGLALAAGYLCDVAARVSGRPLAISSARVRNFCADTRVSTAAMERSGFRPPVSLQEALERTVASVIADEGDVPAARW